MSKPERIGVFGGTFDPIHNVHLEIARAALREARLDRVLFVVSARPPHKHDTACASPEDRYTMVAAAIADEERMEPSRLEMDRKGPSYMWETLEALKVQYPKAMLFLILGADALKDLPHWRHPERIMAAARLLVVPRPGAWDVPSSLAGHYDALRFSISPISSTEVRRRIAAGESLDHLVPSTVMRHILERGLYCDCF